MVLKELLDILRDDCRICVFDCDLVDDDWWDDDDNDNPIVYFGSYRECPASLFSRKISGFMVSDEFVNCLHIELKKEGECDGK